MKYRYDELNNNEFESHRLAMDSIKPNSKVLDIGCATGYLARELSKIGCETWGVDCDELAAKKAENYCKEITICNLDEIDTLPFPENFFDFIVALDVVEHLIHPDKLLSVVKPYLKAGGQIVISVPNIAHASMRWSLLNGHFEYTSTGILDKTHVHFYTMKSFENLIKRAGYKILTISPTNGMCKVPFLYKITDRLPAIWQYKIVKMLPTLFSYQFIAVAKLRKR